MGGCSSVHGYILVGHAVDPNCPPTRLAPWQVYEHVKQLQDAAWHGNIDVAYGRGGRADLERRGC